MRNGKAHTIAEEKSCKKIRTSEIFLLYLRKKDMQVPFRVLEINGDKAVLRSRPKNLIVPVSRLVFTTTGKEFARIKKVYK